MRSSITHLNRPRQTDAKLHAALVLGVLREEDNLRAIAAQILDLQAIYRKTEEKLKILKHCAATFAPK